MQVKKTWGATLTTLQDMTVLEDYDVSQSFTHSPSSESVKSSVSDGYLNKPSLAKKRANQHETELFYFNVSKYKFDICNSPLNKENTDLEHYYSCLYDFTEIP